VKIWVVGKNGLLAKQLARELSAKCLPFCATGHEEVDIRKSEMIHSFIQNYRPDYIFNAAAYTAVDLAEKERSVAYEINVIGPKNLALAASIYGVKLIHFSTDYVFSGKQKIPYLEGDLPEPINYYGQTKYLGEQEIWRHSWNPLIIRTSWLVCPKSTSFLTKIRALIHCKSELSVVNDQFGRPTFATDLAHTALQIKDRSGIYHFANRGETTWFDFALSIFEKEGKKHEQLQCRCLKPIRSRNYKTVAIRPQFSVLNTSKIEDIGIKIRSWKEALAEE
jgi:dTDP-4-dehydrorhamnose reductase